MGRFHSSLPHGYSKVHLRSARERWHLDTEIHHIVPRQFARHPRVLSEQYDVEQDYNLMFMPKRGTRRRPGHSGGHMHYNAFVESHLNDTSTDFLALLLVLHMGCRGRRSVPWR